MTSSDQIRRNLDDILRRVATAASEAGRGASSVRLVGVSKYVDAATTKLLVDAGCIELGESRPQQLWEKANSTELSGTPVHWHMVGHLQRNKVAKTLPHVWLTHAVDSERLLRSINDHADEENDPPRVLLEVNCSGDSEKHGLSASGVRDLVGRLGDFPRVQVEGLMTMAAREGGRQVARENFAALRNLRDELATPGRPLAELSMGMSGDFEEAIAEGATIVRVGTALWEGVRE